MSLIRQSKLEGEVRNFIDRTILKNLNMAIESLKNRLEKNREERINMTDVVEISWRLTAIAM